MLNQGPARPKSKADPACDLAMTACTIESLFARNAALPTVPKVVQQLIESFERDDVSVSTIASQLEADPVLGAKVLRLANSAYFHVSRQIATLDDALRLLGFVMVRNLAVGSGMVVSFRNARGMDLRQFWRHSLHTACVARWLARATGDDADRAFIVGLLHGIGQLLMHAVMHAPLAALNRRCHPLATGRAMHEHEALGFDHAEVGAELARRWRFPPAVVHALRHTASPLLAEPPDDIAALVHVAAWRARIEALRLEPAQAAASCPTAVARTLGIGLEWIEDEAQALLTVDGQPQAMPGLAELAQGMESLFD